MRGQISCKKIASMVEEGVMFVKDGLAWGVTYVDGQSTEKGWVNPADVKNAKVYNPEFVREASSITAAFCFDPNLEEIKKGSLVRVRRTTTVEILRGDEWTGDTSEEIENMD